jgi:hypothetical protein
MELINLIEYKNISFFVNHKIYVKINDFEQKELMINNIFKIDNIIFIKYHFIDDNYKKIIYLYSGKTISTNIFIDDIETFYHNITYKNYNYEK